MLGFGLICLPVLSLTYTLGKSEEALVNVIGLLRIALSLILDQGACNCSLSARMQGSILGSQKRLLCQYLVKYLPGILKKKTKVKDTFYNDKKCFKRRY